MAAPAQFAKKIRQLGRAVEANSSTLVRTVANTIAERVITGTPVKTGQAKSNWIANLDGPAIGTIPPIDKTGAGAISNAKHIIDGYSGEKNSSIHITNNLDYIGILNQGYSNQAPAAFVEIAILAGSDAVHGTRIVR
jgi:hypothetical protein